MKRNADLDELKSSAAVPYRGQHVARSGKLSEWKTLGVEDFHGVEDEATL